MTNLLLYQRIAQQLADDIRRGVYQPGERVPSVRKMSAQLNVSHATVLQAYANLEDQGLIRARPQSGYYVHQTPALTAQTPDIARVERPGLVTRASIIQQVLTEARRDGVFPFGAAVPHVDYLPVRALHQQIAKVTRSTARVPSATCSAPASSHCAGRSRFACAMPACWSTRVR
jgi:transcriptional regulator, GntR family